MVGTIFDRVWVEGNPDNQFRGMQTVLLGSSNGAIVEFMIPQDGSYIMVDHHFANASQGAVGIIEAGAQAAHRRLARPLAQVSGAEDRDRSRGQGAAAEIQQRATGRRRNDPAWRLLRVSC